MAGPFIIFFSYLILSTVMTTISVNAFRNHLKIEVIPIRSQSASYNPSTLKDRIRVAIALPLSDNNFPGSDREYDAIFKRENIPLIGIAVGIIAFSFQLSVLYPWHVELHSSFNTLEVAFFTCHSLIFQKLHHLYFDKCIDFSVADLS